MSRKRTNDPAALAELGRVLIALGDQTRQDILVALSGERLNVGQLAERFPLSRPAISHQLKVLADAGLLVRERHGRERVYRLGTRYPGTGEVASEMVRVKNQGLELLEEKGVTCCYAKADKFWVRDADGVDWEMYAVTADA